ncbi:MAG: hypothetical protein LBL61_00510 [Elusimicrobiota bacterium]|jgi:hypothetical protein|nr:hypothetical protein [Elusimicrobiota bacterium]
MKIKKYFSAVSWPLWVILFFCLAGIARNTYYITFFGFDYATIATKVFVAMVVIYTAQSLLILARKSEAWFISALQVLFCFYVYEDFTFLPAVALVRNIILHYCPGMDYGWLKFLQVSCISALVSLEILKTYLLFILTEELPRRKARAPRARAKNTNAQSA